MFRDSKNNNKKKPKDKHRVGWENTKLISNFKLFPLRNRKHLVGKINLL